jgi:hypothetical protein
MAVNVPAAFESDVTEPPGGLPEGIWAGTGLAGGRLRLCGWYPELAAPALAVMQMADGAQRRFDVYEVLPIGFGPDATLLLVSPLR